MGFYLNKQLVKFIMSAGDSHVNAPPKEGGNEDMVTEVSQAHNIRNEMMQNPRVLAALQQQLDSMVGSNSGYIDSLPNSVKRRIKALKNLQRKFCEVECEFYKEVTALERKYMKKYDPLYAKRKDIITGDYEPNDEECQWESDKKEEDKKEKNEQEEGIKEKLKMDENVKGIPNFWLTIFKSTPMLQEMVQEHDEPILECLEDIKLNFSSPESPLSFTLEFHFAQNSYFTNKVLTKTYQLVSTIDEAAPFSFEGPEISTSTGCSINWNKGKNVTMKTVEKKQKHKNKGTTRTISKEVPTDSFFNFFSPPEAGEDEELDEEMEALVTADIEIGHLLKERVIPRAVLFFTGEVSDDEYDDDDEDDDDDDENYDLDEGSDENDADYDPEKDPNAKETPQECNQQ